MRKFILVLAALFFSVSAQAHVSAVPFPEVGSLNDVAHPAAFFMPQTYLPPSSPQITCNVVTGVASVSGPCTSPVATCNGDAQAVTRVVSITSGTKILTTSTNTFAPGDVNKTIVVQDMNSLVTADYNFIDVYTSPTQVTLRTNSLVTLSAVSKNIGLGTDDSPAFAAFNTWAVANQGSTNQVVLTVPNGSSCWFGSVSGLGTSFARSINNLIVEGTGATLSSENGAQFTLGAPGMCGRAITAVDGCTARIQSVSAGSSTVTLTAASLAAGYVSRFVAGRWLLVAGVNAQAIIGSGSGYPANETFFEWRQMTNVNAGTGVITLDRPLTGSYLSTWPMYQDGSSTGDNDQGGPATIFASSQYWGGTSEFRGLTINQGSNQTYARNRNVTYRNVTFGGGFGAIPTENETWTTIGSSFPGVTMETDKLVGTMTLDSTSILRIDFQSSSTQSLVMQNGTTVTTMFGSANSSTISDTTFGTLRPGPFAYGAAIGAFTCTRCKVTTAFEAQIGVSQRNSPALTSMSGGVITFLNSDVTGTNGPPSRVYIPGGNVMFNTSDRTSVGLFKVTGLTQDATNTYVQTNQAGGFPSVATIGGGPIGFRTHPAPIFTCTDPDAASIIDFKSVCTNAGAPSAAPLGQYSSMSFTPSAQTNVLASMPGWGKIVSLTINVTQAYTGSGSQELRPTGQAVIGSIKQSDWTAYNWIPTINTKVAGTRIITPSGTTCNTGGGPIAGACSGDACIAPATGCFTLPEAIWLPDILQPGIFGTFSGGVNPQFTITIQTDQGVVP